MSASAIKALTEKVDRLEAEKAIPRSALTYAADALALIVVPNAITGSTVANAWAQSFSAESFARSVLAKTKEGA